MDPITITAGLQSSSMHVINFTNPLDIATHISVSLKGRDVEQFCLLMKHTNSILLHPGMSLDIPIMFVPELMRSHVATVIVADEKDCALQWCYPLIGQPELRTSSPNSLLNVTCRAKERLEQKLVVSLINSLDKCSAATAQTLATSTGLYIFITRILQFIWFVPRSNGDIN